ncbi:dihydrofolate reductase family protein [Rhizobium sp. RAF56]|jgi:dihydrofolate reductase|uniref:dihydrofolate reductase family protein n=1 Tax=Rhizobium sp. RAF56 TaxID=3233062 RepID=UPI003F94BC42
MRKVSVFLSISIDGYFTGSSGDMSWSHNEDPEFNAFVAGNASSGGELLMGRITYEMMASFWPTPFAKQSFPEVAEGMNGLPKVVFSRTLQEVSWNNTRLAKNAPTEEVRRLKAGAGPDLVVLGSGSIARQLAEAGLVDEFQFVVVPVALGSGRTMFDGIDNRLALKLTRSRTFANGNTLLCYAPA